MAGGFVEHGRFFQAAFGLGVSSWLRTGDGDLDQRAGRVAATDVAEGFISAKVYLCFDALVHDVVDLPPEHRLKNHSLQIALHMLPPG